MMVRWLSRLRTHHRSTSAPPLAKAEDNEATVHPQQRLASHKFSTFTIQDHARTHLGDHYGDVHHQHPSAPSCTSDTAAVLEAFEFEDRLLRKQQLNQLETVEDSFE